MQYDAFGQRTYVKYGNGAESTYTYEPVMRRLENLKTTSTDGKVLQNITYKYDKVGNITNRNNSGFNTNDDVRRNSEQSYEYDKMDRLTGSTGKFNYETWNPFWDKRVNTYTSEMTYSNTGKILTKTQENRGLFEDTGQTVEIPETTYDWAYEYTGAHPNAVTKAGTRSMSYDLNGNMTQMTDSPLTPGGGTMTRTLAWDDENRLLKTTDSPRTPTGGNDTSVVTTYSYDSSGMRVLKKGRYGTAQYVSENYTVRNKDLISKHVFAGNTRLVSRVVMNEEKSGKMTATEQGSYYYHPDHLGSSSVVTDKQGKFYEQIEYFPYGETWINNKATAEQTSSPYKFTGKEYDPETGWYYFGWRYFDPKLSRWISADPPLARGDYLPVPAISDEAKQRNANLPGMGGVFNTINIDAYHYAGDNPVKFVDPDGEAITPETAWDIASLIVSIGQFGFAINDGDAKDIVLAAGAVVFDAVAVTLPIVPGGAGILLKASKKAAEQSKYLVSASQSAYKEYKGSGGNNKSTAAAFISDYAYGKASKGVLKKAGDKIDKLDPKKDIMSRAFEGVKSYVAPKGKKHIAPAAQVVNDKIIKRNVSETVGTKTR